MAAGSMDCPPDNRARAACQASCKVRHQKRIRTLQRDAVRLRGDGGAVRIPPTTELPSATDRLDSWKDIAAYLHRDVSTVQRWEKREGMPVHRHVH